MIFRDAIAASDIRCAVRELNGRRIYRYLDGKIEIFTRNGWRWWRWCERLWPSLASPVHRDWEPVGLGSMNYGEAITRLERAEARARPRITGCLLLVVVSLLPSGCALAPLVVGLLVDTTVGSVGIYQRAEHKDELATLNAQIAALRQAMTPQLRTTSDRLREER